MGTDSTEVVPPLRDPICSHRFMETWSLCTHVICGWQPAGICLSVCLRSPSSSTSRQIVRVSQLPRIDGGAAKTPFQVPPIAEMATLTHSETLHRRFSSFYHEMPMTLAWISNIIRCSQVVRSAVPNISRPYKL